MLAKWKSIDFTNLKVVLQQLKEKHVHKDK